MPLCADTSYILVKLDLELESTWMKESKGNSQSGSSSDPMMNYGYFPIARKIPRANISLSINELLLFSYRHGIIVYIKKRMPIIAVAYRGTLYGISGKLIAIINKPRTSTNACSKYLVNMDLESHLQQNKTTLYSHLNDT